jgi:hypothetical protein
MQTLAVFEMYKMYSLFDRDGLQLNVSYMFLY